MSKTQQRKTRRCLRCGCTDARACLGGCSWLCDALDICSDCLSVPETFFIESLQTILSLCNQSCTPRPAIMLHTSFRLNAFFNVLNTQRIDFAYTLAKQTGNCENPVWDVAWTLSEILNDNAPIGWSRYISTAELLLAKYTIKSKTP
jgi:hypothetical protein